MHARTTTTTRWDPCLVKQLNTMETPMPAEDDSEAFQVHGSRPSEGSQVGAHFPSATFGVKRRVPLAQVRVMHAPVAREEI